MCNGEYYGYSSLVLGVGDMDLKNFVLLMVMADNLSYHLKNNDSSVLDTEDKDHSLKTIP
jgi:hypothetical protein